MNRLASWFEKGFPTIPNCLDLCSALSIHHGLVCSSQILRPVSKRPCLVSKQHGVHLGYAPPITFMPVTLLDPFEPQELQERVAHWLGCNDHRLAFWELACEFQQVSEFIRETGMEDPYQCTISEVA